MLYSLRARIRMPTAPTKTHRHNILRLKSSSSINDNVLVEETPTKVVLTINRPKVLNAVSIEMVSRILQLLKNFEKSKTMVIIKGAGDKSFSVGGDVGAIVTSDLPTAKNCFREVYTTNYLIRNYKIPYIAFIDGLTMGGGVGLSVHGTYRIATERTVLAMPEAGIGLFPDIGSSYFLSRLSGKLGFYLGMTGHRLIGEDVVKAGIATHFCDSSKLGKLESTLVESSNPNDIAGIVNSFTSKSSEEFGLKPHLDTINKCFAGKSVENIFQNLERDGSEWAINTLATLKKMSPLSLKLTHRQFEQGANLSIGEALRMEYRAVCRCMDNSDFQEGVRALIIDKDKKPKWNPPTIEGVTDDRVASFFVKLPDNEELKL